MSEPFLAEIRIVGFNFAPRGWAFCDGQILPINQNQSLYSLLGTTYGGDGRTSFALPDLRGRTPTHVGNGHPLGQRGGEETHTLSTAEMPAHRHVVRASSVDGTSPLPADAALARSTNQIYHEPTNLEPMNSGSVASVGGSQGHENMQPFITLNFCIALMGLFPSRN
ncbi:MAG: tail fiber protein [Proteobacteria bacterium]|nr:tail fiber protein [Pseudomonadota bacterium]